MANANTSLNGYEFGRSPKTQAPFWGGGSEGAEIDDTGTYTDKTWSSKKISDELSEKADKTELANYAKVTSVYTKAQTYTKKEVDELLSHIEPTVDAYTKSQTDELLAGKADKATTYTKAQVDELISDIPAIDAYTKAQTDNLLADKADKSDTYTKTQVDNLIPDVSGFATKTELNSGLASKADETELASYAKVTSVYTKSQTYTKAEVDNLISGAGGGVEIDDNAVVANKTWSSQKIDSEIYNATSGKANSGDVYTKTQTNNLLANKADASAVYTKTQTDNLLSNKANASDVYTKTQSNNLLANKADKANSMRYDTTNSKTQYNNNGVWTDVPQSGGSEPLAQRLLGVFSNYDIYTGYLLDAKLGISIGADTVANAIPSAPFSHILDYDAPYKIGELGDNDLKIVPIGTKFDTSAWKDVDVNMYVYKTGTYTGGSTVVDYVAELNKILNKVVNGNPDGTEEFFKAVQTPLYGVNYYAGSSGWTSSNFNETDSTYGIQYTSAVEAYEMYTSAGTTFEQKIHAIGWKDTLATGKIYVKRGSSNEWIDVNISDVKTRYNDTNYDISLVLIQNTYSIKAKHHPNYLTWNNELSQMLTWYD